MQTISHKKYKNEYNFHVKKNKKTILQYVGVFALEFLLGRTLNFLFQECLRLVFLGFSLIEQEKKKKNQNFLIPTIIRTSLGARGGFRGRWRSSQTPKVCCCLNIGYGG